jgi:hypothetical protein
VDGQLPSSPLLHVKKLKTNFVLLIHSDLESETARDHLRSRHKWKNNIKRILNRMWTGFSRLRIWPSATFCEHINEPLGSIKGRGFLEQLSNYQPLKKKSASWS